MKSELNFNPPVPPLRFWMGVWVETNLVHIFTFVNSQHFNNNRKTKRRIYITSFDKL